jgi:hypothetical protein
MRLRSLLPTTSLILLFLLAPACGGGGDDDTVDAAPGTVDAGGGGNADAAWPDAAGGGGAAVNLGEPCGAMACPGGEDCITLQGLGSTTEGFCTIPCTANPDCTDGYVGPGSPQCVLSDGMMPPNLSCGIVCTGGAGSCPDGLGCFATGMGATMLCAGDEGT